MGAQWCEGAAPVTSLNHTPPPEPRTAPSSGSLWQLLGCGADVVMGDPCSCWSAACLHQLPVKATP